MPKLYQLFQLVNSLTSARNQGGNQGVRVLDFCSMGFYGERLIQ